MGNNEVIGPSGTGTVFSQQTPPLALIRASLALKTTCTGQWLDALLQQLRPSSEAALGWGGLSMFLGQQVRGHDPRLNVLGGQFDRNLGDLIALGTNAGAAVEEELVQRLSLRRVVGIVRIKPVFALNGRCSFGTLRPR